MVLSLRDVFAIFDFSIMFILSMRMQQGRGFQTVGHTVQSVNNYPERGVMLLNGIFIKRSTG